MINNDIYKNRFEDLKTRQKIWNTLVNNYFQTFIKNSDVVLDFGCGYCEFINAVICKKKYAFDLDKNYKQYASKNVTFLSNPKLPTNIDKIFISNVFEHLERNEITSTIKSFYQILNKGGQVLVLQPNIRFASKDYWMFFDHITPIDDRALAEIFKVYKFKLVKSVPHFLPFTTKSRLSNFSFLTSLYLKLPIAWRFFGKQSFLIFEK
jgi:SAM-dependent methyltransferase